MIFRRHGVRRLPDGGLRVALSTNEHTALAALPGRLEPIVAGEADDEGAEALRARLFPTAYDDPELEMEFRELAGDDLVRGRLDALEAFRKTLEGGRTSAGTWTTDLEPDEAQAWLGVVNDARLLLAGIVGIRSERAWERGPDPSDPASLMLWYLGWLEEQLLAALMDELPEE